MYNNVLEYNLLIRSRVQLYSYSGIEYNLDLFPFGPTLSHILKPNWNGPKGYPN